MQFMYVTGKPKRLKGRSQYAQCLSRCLAYLDFHFIYKNRPAILNMLNIIIICTCTRALMHEIVFLKIQFIQLIHQNKEVPRFQCHLILAYHIR